MVYEILDDLEAFDELEGHNQLQGSGDGEGDGVEDLKDGGEVEPGQGEEDDLLGGAAIAEGA